MLHFFRKHQKYFFLFTTIIIVTSFAFFGSYQAFAPAFGKKGPSDEVVFHSVDGKAVKRSYLDHMSRFLEREDWMQSAKIFDSNYLNDGVISKDFLEGGLSDHLLAHFGDHYVEELSARQAKEKNFVAYQHPYIPSLSTVSIWSLFSPEIPEKLATLKVSEDPIGSFDDRVELFLAERNFPPAFLTQVLRYQERDQARVPADPRLQKDVISLFGYHDHNDWFGEHFVQSVAEVVINTAAIARQKGYSVSHEEALTELLSKSQKTYEAISANMNLPVENGYEFFQIYLRQKGLDEATVVRLWEDITLYRRMMQEVGSAALVDALPLEQFYAYANEHATIELYQMAPELRFKTDEEAQLFAAYLDAVAPNRADTIPLELASIETIEERAPKLVGKRYRVYVGSVDKKMLQGKVSVKETWDWELANWEQLKETFPELTLKEGTPFEILEKVEKRKKIDSYACAQIVESHPEWIDEAVRDVTLNETELFLSPASEKAPLPGVTDVAAFQQVLDSENEVVGYTQDQKRYYRILVDERSENKEVLSFKEAKGVLTPVADAPAISFAAYLEKYRSDLPEGALWGIEKKEVTISRANPSFISLDEVLALEGDGFSPVAEAEKEGAYCFRLKEVLVDTTIPMQKWIEAQELLAKEMRAQYFESVLSQLCSKNSSL